MKMNAKLLISLTCVSLGLTACSDDYFDQEAYDAKLKQAFPVDNVDPTHTWATMGTAQINATVNGDYGETYRVAVYKENPLTTSPVTLLTAASVTSGSQASLTLSFPLASPFVYVACYDKYNHYLVKAVEVSDGATVDVNFFGEDTSAAARAVQKFSFPNWKDYHTRSNLTRTDPVTVDFTGGSWQVSGGGAAIIPLSDAAKSLVQANNYIGAIVEQWNPYDWCTHSIYFKDGWNGSGLSGTEKTIPEGKHLYEIKLTSSDVEKILNSSGISIAGSFYTASRVYISTVSHKDDDASINFLDGSTSDSGSSDGSGGSGGSSSSWTFDGQTTYMDATTYTKAKETKISVSNWVNPSWFTGNKISVDMSTIDTSGDFKSMSQNVIANNEVQQLADNANVTKKWWRIGSATTINGINQKICDNQSVLNTGVVYVKGKLYMSANDAAQRVTWIVGDGGEIIINQETTIAEWGRIVVMPGGTLTVGNNSKITFSGKEGSVGFYNAGTASFPNTLALNGISESGGSVIYNVGTLTLHDVTSLRTLYNYGTLTLNSDISIINDNELFTYPVYNEGSITFTDKTINTRKNCVNYGTLTGKSLISSEGSFLFNRGTINVSDDIFYHTVYNLGHLEADQNTDYNERVLVNGCYLHYRQGYEYDDTKVLKKFISLRNSRTVIDGPFYLIDKGVSYMEANSLLECQGFGSPTNCTITGPTGNGEFAIVKIKGEDSRIKVQNYHDMQFAGTLYFDWDNILDASYHIDFKYLQPINGEESDADKRAADVEALLNSYMKIFISESTSPANITIPAGDCTGTGYNTTPPTIITPPEEVVQGYRFCFEDNFPTPGDYDFNDCVITVYPKVEGTNVELTVSLDGVGATKTIAAALRLVGINESDITSASCNADLNSGQQSGSVYARVTPVQELGTNVFAVTDKGFANGSKITDMVVRLFDNAHYAMSGGTSYDSKFYNTVSPSDPLASESYVDNTKPSRTMTFTFEVSDEDKAQQFLDESIYDVFIVENHNGKTYEVHTFSYKFDEVLGAYYGNGTKLTAYKNTVTVNYPWAVCVPHSSTSPFYYPREWWSISGTKIQEGQDTENYGGTPAVYPDFKSWAADKSQSQEWYENPVMDRVFKLD